jgi:hypothetical protein
MRSLRNSTYEDTIEIRRRFKLNDAHVRRLLRFPYLAPDIIEAIIEGRQPHSSTVRQLLQGIPCSWSEQQLAANGSRQVFDHRRVDAGKVRLPWIERGRRPGDV